MLSLACQVLRIAELRTEHCGLPLRPLVQAAEDHGYELVIPKPRKDGAGPEYIRLHLASWSDAVFYLFPDRLTFRATSSREGQAAILRDLSGESVEYEEGSSHIPEVRFWHTTDEGMDSCYQALAAMAEASPVQR